MRFLRRYASTVAGSFEKLPFPSLKQACIDLQASISVLAPSEQALKVASLAIRELEDPQVVDVYERLHQEHLASSDHYLESLWLDMYLDGRDALPVYVSPTHAFKPVMTAPFRTAPLLASAMIHAGTKVALQVKNGDLSIRLGKRFMDPWQLRHHFSTFREPGTHTDRLVTLDEMAPYVILSCLNGQLFKLPVLDNAGNLLSERTIAHLVEEACHLATSAPTTMPVGVLSGLKRDEWAQHYQLIKLAREGDNDNEGANARHLATVEEALFVVCLDKIEAPVHAPGSLQDALMPLNHNNGLNRWFDKLQFIVTENGRAGLTWEHTDIDGISSITVADAVLREMSQSSLITGDTANESEHASNSSFNSSSSASSNASAAHAGLQHLQWTPNPAIGAAIEAELSRQTIAKSISHRTPVEFRLWKGSRWGSLFAKGRNCSPDAFVQTLFQLARFIHAIKSGAEHPRLVSTYESVSMAMYHHGRTECMRSATPEQQHFAQAVTLQRSRYQATELEALCRDAMRAHTQRLGRTQQQGGVDRILFALRAHSSRADQLLSDDLFVDYRTDRLSTSGLVSEGVEVFAFGPVCGDGLGLAYSMAPEELRVVVSSYGNCADDFMFCLTEAGIVMEEILTVSGGDTVSGR